MTDGPRIDSVVVDTSQSRHARLQPVPVGAVKLADGFWAPRLRANRKVTLPSQRERLQECGAMVNFRRAAGKTDSQSRGMAFRDSDLYKSLEAVSWALADAGEDAAALAQMADDVIAEVEAAQGPDGYLNTYFTFDKASERWSNLARMHELYTAGHLMQAGLAHYRCTGGERLLNVARRAADNICEVFGPEEKGKRLGCGGHPEIEMALVELARCTGESNYLEQAQFFLDMRGRGLAGGQDYFQDHVPFRELERMTGHAVRAAYLNAGAADIYAETGERRVRKALERMWHNMTEQQMYMTGGIGSRYQNEAFGRDYELPAERAYAETCAAIASVMWNARMLALDGEARYADVLERALYNGVLSGLSLDGTSYFYVDPLSDDGTHRRQQWFGCACCPPNIARLLASLPGYFYSVSEEGVWVHLYAESSASVELPQHGAVNLTQRTRYPWDGDVTVEVGGGGTFSLMLRVPDWCEQGAALEVCGEAASGPLEPGTYAEVRRDWRPGDRVRLTLPMPVRRVECHPYVAENVHRTALMRGPLVYCVEQVDNPGVDPREVILPPGAELEESFRPDLLGGVTVLCGEAKAVAPGRRWKGCLYRTADTQRRRNRAIRLTAVPYCAWANREPGPMQVWLRAR